MAFDNAKLVCTKTDGTKYDFNHFSLAINNQTEFKILINNLNDNYNPRISKKIKEKNTVLKLTDARDEIIDLFEEGIFPFKGNVFKTKEEESEENKLEKIKDDYKNVLKYIEDESKSISYELFEKYFYFSAPTVLVKTLYETKDKKENNK